MSDRASTDEALTRLTRRLERVESNAAFAEDALGKLDGVVRAFADRVAALEETVRVLEGRLEGPGAAEEEADSGA